MRAWIRAVRPAAHLNLALPVAFGEAFAHFAIGHIDPIGVLWAHVFALTAQPVIIFSNDLADEQADSLLEANTILAGGSRVLVDGSISRSNLRRALSIAVTVHLLVGGGASLWLDNWLPLICSLATIGLMQAYSFGPLRLSYRGGGALLQALGTGIVLPLVGSSLASSGTHTPPWMILLATFLLGAVSNWVTSIPDADRDAMANKRSLAGRFGARSATRMAFASLAVISLLGFGRHGRLDSQLMPTVSVCALLCLGVAGVLLWRKPSAHVLHTWMLLAVVQVFWVGWSLTLFLS